MEIKDITNIMKNKYEKHLSEIYELAQPFSINNKVEAINKEKFNEILSSSGFSLLVLLIPSYVK